MGGEMGFIFSDLQVSQKQPFVRGYKYDHQSVR